MERKYGACQPRGGGGREGKGRHTEPAPYVHIYNHAFHAFCWTTDTCYSVRTYIQRHLGPNSLGGGGFHLCIYIYVFMHGKSSCDGAERESFNCLHFRRAAALTCGQCSSGSRHGDLAPPALSPPSGRPPPHQGEGRFCGARRGILPVYDRRPVVVQVISGRTKNGF